MLKAVKSFFEQTMEPDNPADMEHRLRMATAALLIEMMMQDDHEHEDEQQSIKQILANGFELSERETSELYNLAQEEVRDATDYFQFTNLIARNYSQQQKVRLVELLWTVAFADGHLDKYEEHMVRRIADLIHVSHTDFITTRNKVKKSLRPV